MTYICECGKEFDKPNSFNGHKSHCKVHLEKTGRLELRKNIDKSNITKRVNTCKLKKENKIKSAREIGISEIHTCEKCGKILTEKYGSGRFCSQSCANARDRSDDLKLKISNSVHKSNLDKYNESPRKCIKCEEYLPFEHRFRKYCDKCKSEITLERNNVDSKRYKYSLNPKYCAFCGNPIDFDNRYRKYCSDECFKNFMSIDRKQKFKDGKITYSNVRNKYKYGTYKGISCDSSYELALVIYLIDNKIQFERNRTISFPYEYNGSTHNFFPDFIVRNTYVELKNRHSEETEAKCRCIPDNISFKILYGKDLKPVFDYVISKYGKDYIKLYDRNYPSWMDKGK